jgi:hypothetical protein
MNNNNWKLFFNEYDKKSTKMLEKMANVEISGIKRDDIQECCYRYCLILQIFWKKIP